MEKGSSSNSHIFQLLDEPILKIGRNSDDPDFRVLCSSTKSINNRKKHAKFYLHELEKSMEKMNGIKNKIEEFNNISWYFIMCILYFVIF